MSLSRGLGFRDSHTENLRNKGHRNFQKTYSNAEDYQDGIGRLGEEEENAEKKKTSVMN